jgi:hypothetical protein
VDLKNCPRRIIPIIIVNAQECEVISEDLR